MAVIRDHKQQKQELEDDSLEREQRMYKTPGTKQKYLTNMY